MTTAVVSQLNFATIPDLIAIQRKSFQSFLEKGLIEELNTRNPIYNSDKSIKFTFYPKHYKLYPPEDGLAESIRQGKTYACRLYVPAELTDLESKQKSFQWVFLGSIPLMTKRGHFLLNGTPRVIINQLIRSPGVYYQESLDKKRRRNCYADLISQRGTWLRFELDRKNRAWVKMKKTPKIPATLLLQALGLSSTEILAKVSESSWILPSAEVPQSINELFLAYQQYHYRSSEEYKIETTKDRALILLALILYPKKDISEISTDLAKKFLFRKFLNPRTYSLGTLGRQRLNAKFSQNTTNTSTTLTPEDILNIFNDLSKLEQGSLKVDDIDHLKNRRVRASGELLQNQLGIGLLRLERVIKERLKRSTFSHVQTTSLGLGNKFVSSHEEINLGNHIDRKVLFQCLDIRKLVSSKPVNTSFREFFGSSQLSQFLDQTNPLAEITHKRRFTCLGPGGVNKDTAGMAVRGIHPSHYGRICPIETPEGQNAGLVNSPTIFSTLSTSGFLVTPFYPVSKGQVQKDPIFLSADKEEKFIVAPPDLKQSVYSFLESSSVPIRYKNNFSRSNSESVDFVGISPLQMISLATALVPFLEHDDANRALMGSNMQRQAVPLVRPQRPIVGTGLETRAVLDSGSVIQADLNGYIYSVTNKRIILFGSKETNKLAVKIYPLMGYHRSNQDTSLFHRPVVTEGQWVEIGDILADCSASMNGDLSLGKNICVAYMPWEGYNFEDAILINERLVQEDLYTSIHVEKFTIEAKETKYGLEEITSNLPELSESLRQNLGENGIIREGSWVKEGDVLVGKSTPVSRKLLSPHEKLLYDVVGKQVPKMADTSLRVPKGVEGRVLGIEVLDQTNLSLQTNKINSFSQSDSLKVFTNSTEFTSNIDLETTVKEYNNNLSYRLFGEPKMNMSGITYPIERNLITEKNEREDSLVFTDNKFIKSFSKFNFSELTGQVKRNTDINKDLNEESSVTTSETAVQELSVQSQVILDLFDKNPKEENLDSLSINDQLAFTGNSNSDTENQLADHLVYNSNSLISKRFNILEGKSGSNESMMKSDFFMDQEEDYSNSISGPVQINIYLAQKRKIQVGDKMAGRHGNKGIVSQVLPRQDMPYLPDGRPVDIVLNPLGVPSRMNVGQVFECLLGLAGFYLDEQYRISAFDEMFGSETSRSITYHKLYEASKKTKQPWIFNPNHPGKMKIFDGRTGEAFDQAVMIGQAYMLKLVHLVDDKIHARSTGPYSLVTQQPLRGRSKHGGQRLGEMEVWAIEGFGAAYTLQELLTVKSDDLKGRHQVVDVILNSETMDFATPESFKVLVRELQALCLDIGCYGLTVNGELDEIDMKQLDLAISRFESIE